MLGLEKGARTRLEEICEENFRNGRKLKVLAGEQCKPPFLDRGQGISHRGLDARAKPDTD